MKGVTMQTSQILLVSACAVTLSLGGADLSPLPRPEPFFAATKSGETATPQFRTKKILRPDRSQDQIYEISCGENSIQTANIWNAKTVQEYISLTLNGKKVLFYFYANGKLNAGVYEKVPRQKMSVQCDEKKGSFESSGTIRKKEADASYAQGFRINPDGTIRAHWEIRNLPGCAGLLTGHFAVPYGGTLLLNRKAIRLPQENTIMKESETRLFVRERLHAFELQDPSGKSLFRMKLPEGNRARVTLCRQKDGLYPGNIRLEIWTEKGRIPVDLNLSQGQTRDHQDERDSFHGIHAWKHSRMILPDYSKCRNLLMNPSFEAGFRYYHMGQPWRYYLPRKKAVFEITDKEAVFGKKSLKFTLENGDEEAGYLYTFTLPVRLEQTYTISFYAKSDTDGMRLRLRGSLPSHKFVKFQNWKGGQRTWGRDVCDSGDEFVLSRKWTRYSVTFKAPALAFTFGIAAKYKKADGPAFASAYLDGLQIEEGNTASEFAERPVLGELVTNSSENYFNAGEKVNPVFRIRTTKQETSGTVRFTVTNFFGETIWTGTRKFSTGSNTATSLPLPFEDQIQFGLYILRADYSLDNGWKDYDFFRIMRVRYPDPSNPLRDYFTVKISDLDSALGEAVARRLFRSGFGVVETEERTLAPRKFDGCGSPAFVNRLCEENHLKHDSAMLFQYLNTLLYLDPRFEELSGVKKGWNWCWLVNLKRVSPELEAEVEKLSAEAAAALPWVKYWDLRREMEGFRLIHRRQFDDAGRLLTAALRGIRKGNPAAKFRMGDTSHLSNLPMTKQWIDLMKQYGKGDKADLFSSNHYRKKPEIPDLDTDLAQFFRLGDRNGYPGAKLHLLEGMYWHYDMQPNYAPEWGKMRDYWCGTIPSYSFSYNERLYAKYSAREWLLGLKYYPRLERMNLWGHRYMDLNLTPQAVEKIPNSLLDLLGNARFHSDLRFAPGVRCLIFEDPRKRPTAAIWSYLDEVDRENRKAPLFHFPFGSLRLRYFDLMGNERSAKQKDGMTFLPVDGTPLFIKGEAGTTEALIAALNQGGSREALGRSELEINPRIIDTKTMELKVANHVSRPVKARISMRINDRIVEKELQMKGGENESVVRIPLGLSFSPGKIHNLNIPIAVTTENKTENLNYNVRLFQVPERKTPLNIDSTENDWKAYPEIRLANKTYSQQFIQKTLKNRKEGYPGDFQVSFQMAWDPQALYLRIKVVDDQFFGYEHGYHNWENDCIQMYMDPLADAPRMSQSHGYGLDDLAFNFYGKQDGSVRIRRERMPDVQLQGGVASAKLAGTWVEPDMMQAKRFTTRNGYVYNIIIPGYNLRPYILRKDAVAGFGLMATDNDGDLHRKVMHTILPPGKEGYQNPSLYPLMILE